MSTEPTRTLLAEASDVPRPMDTSTHFLDGGTFVTNIDEEDVAAMEQAVQEHGDPCVVVHDSPCCGGASMKGWKSLHLLKWAERPGHWPKGPSLSPLWDIFYRIKGAPRS